MSGEAAFIAALRAVATHPAARGLADDCAVLEFGGETLVLTHDMMVEGVHWLPRQPVDSLDHHVVGQDQCLAAEVEDGAIVGKATRGGVGREFAQSGDEVRFSQA